MFNGQCFPLYYYEENTAAQFSLFDSNDRSDRYIRHARRWTLAPSKLEVSFNYLF